MGGSKEGRSATGRVDSRPNSRSLIWIELLIYRLEKTTSLDIYDEYRGTKWKEVQL